MRNTILFITLGVFLLVSTGYTGNIKDISTNIDPQKESIIIGCIQVPNNISGKFLLLLGPLSLYDELKSLKEKLKPLTEHRKVEYSLYFTLIEESSDKIKGYFFVAAPHQNTSYMLRINERQYDNIYHNILHFLPKKGKLINLGTIRIRIENKIKYYFDRIADSSALLRFKDVYPDVYEKYKTKIYEPAIILKKS